MTALAASGIQPSLETVKILPAKNQANSILVTGIKAAPKIDQPQYEVTGRLDTLEWTETDHVRFQGLACKEATGAISYDEQADLELLSKKRRSNEFPRTGEEVIFEFRQMLVTQELVNSLRKFVSFYECPSSQRQTSNRKFT